MVLLTGSAWSHGTYRDYIVDTHLDAACPEEIQCALCHTVENGGEPLDISEEGENVGGTARRGTFFAGLMAQGWPPNPEHMDDGDAHRDANVAALGAALTAMAAVDGDADGVADIDELNAGYNPLVADTAGAAASLCGNAAPFPMGMGGMGAGGDGAGGMGVGGVGMGGVNAAGMGMGGASAGTGGMGTAGMGVAGMPASVAGSTGMGGASGGIPGSGGMTTGAGGAGNSAAGAPVGSGGMTVAPGGTPTAASGCALPNSESSGTWWPVTALLALGWVVARRRQ